MNARRIHFIGIGGIGMSGIARIMLDMGYQISGSDCKSSPLTDTLVAMGAKTIETRSWATKHRGLLAIHAGKGAIPSKWRNPPPHQKALFNQFTPDLEALPRSQILCIADLIDCRIMTQDLIDSLTDQERAFGEYSVGRYAWYLKLVKTFEPVIPAKGSLGL